MKTSTSLTNGARGGLAGLLARLEAFFANLFSFIPRRSRTQGSRPHQSDARQRRQGSLPSPADIGQTACQEAERHALDWGFGEVMYPNRVEVLVGQRAWTDCYATMTRACQERIAQILDEYVRDRGYTPGAWEVVLGVDPMLGDDDVQVQVFFEADAKGRDHTVCLDDERTAVAHTVPAQSAVLSPVITSHDKPSAVSHDSKSKARKPKHVSKPSNKDVVAPVGSAPSARARLCIAGKERTVHDSSTIGRSRYVGRDVPDIDLHGEEGFDMVSHLHGRFSYRGEEGWSFTSTGRNGTKLVHAGTTRDLQTGTSYTLVDGDVLRLGDERSEVVFLCA